MFTCLKSPIILPLHQGLGFTSGQFSSGFPVYVSAVQCMLHLPPIILIRSYLAGRANHNVPCAVPFAVQLPSPA